MNRQYQEKLAAKKVAQLNLELCKNKVQVVSIKNDLKNLEEKINEFEDTQLNKEKVKLDEMRKEQEEIDEKLRKFVTSKSNEIFNITDSNKRKSIEELKCENSEQAKLNKKHNREWTLCCSNLEKSKDELSNFINYKLDHHQKETLEKYGLLNLEQLDKLLENRKNQWGTLTGPFYNRFAPSKKLWGIHPYYGGEKLESIIENRENIDKHVQELKNTYQRLLDNLNEIDSKIDKIDRDSNEHNSNLEQLEIEYNEKNDELIKMKNENNKIEDKMLQAQNNVNIVSFEIKVDKVKNKIQILKDSLNQLQRNKKLNNDRIKNIELIKPYWESVINANSELTSKEEEIWMSGNKSRELKVHCNNYSNILKNINQYRTESTRSGYGKQVSYFTECDIKELKMLDEQFDFSKNYEEYAEKVLYEKDNGIRLFCTLIKKYEIDYTQIITDINRLEELEPSINNQNVICNNLNKEKWQMNQIKIEKEKQIKNYESEIIPTLINELEDAKTLWELEKAYIEFERASIEVDNISIEKK
tara:strand:- start:147 stop:1733 length:1587 start_codon:yes stop_codon:yes gene_type:complete